MDALGGSEQGPLLLGERRTVAYGHCCLRYFTKQAANSHSIALGRAYNPLSPGQQKSKQVISCMVFLELSIPARWF